MNTPADSDRWACLLLYTLPERRRGGIMESKTHKDFKYTIVLDGNFADAAGRVEEPAEAEHVRDDAHSEHREMMDRLYYEYEKMCLKDPNTLDKDDIYPHTYQWRLGDKYDAGKAPVLEEAVRQGVRIADTEAYRKYIEEVKNRKFEPDSWD